MTVSSNDIMTTATQSNSNRSIDFRYSPRVTWTCIGRPDDPHKSLVSNSGALLYEWGGQNGNPFAKVIEFGVKTDEAPLSVSQYSDDPGNSIVVTVIRYPKATLTLRTFGHQHDDGKRSDVVLWNIDVHPNVGEFMTSLWIDASASGRYFAPYRQEKWPGMLFEVISDTLINVAPLGELPQPSEDRPAELSLMPGELAFISSPQPLFAHWGFRQGPSNGLTHEPRLLSGGESVEGAIIIPLNHQTYDGLDFEWAKAALISERSFWADHPAQTLELVVPDDDVMAMVQACSRNILQAREIKDGLPEFQVGPTIYRGLWVVDGHFLLETARYMGLAEDAAHGIEALLRRVKPDGSIAQFPFHDKETGISIATLVRQTELSGDWETLRERWPIILHAVEYIRARRKTAAELEDSNLAKDLMPPTFADGGLSDVRPEYTTALWTLFGLQEAAKAARYLGFSEDENTISNDFEALKSDFNRLAARDLATLPSGVQYLPMRIPGGSGDHNSIANLAGEIPPWYRVNPGTATWALCQAIYPGEVFGPDDPITQNLLALYDEIDDEEGIPVETGWLPFKSLWNYNAGFAAQVFLYSGRPDKAIDYLYAFANHASPTRVWREEQSLHSTGHNQYVGDMPHNWASAEFIRLVRHLLVFEKAGGLELLPGLPLEWLRPGKSITVQQTPTRFGPVSLFVVVDNTGRAKVTLEQDLSWRTLPSATTLVVPEGYEVEGTSSSVRRYTLPRESTVTAYLRPQH